MTLSPLAQPARLEAPDLAAPHLHDSVPCRNCGSPVSRTYCGDCGQRYTEELDPSLREILHEAGEELLHLDGKLGVTLRLLFTSPGRLTREYLDGRRARYLSPLRVYLTCSVLFFFVMALTPTNGALDLMTVRQQTPAGAVERRLTRAERDSVGRAMELRARKARGLWAAALRGIARGEEEPEAARHEMVSAMPKIMFVLVPFFALVTGVAYRSRRLHYPTHLIFALHVFAFYFAVSAVARLVRLAGTPAVASLASRAAVLGTVLYVVIALRRTYGGRAWTTALRLAVLLALFGMGFVTVITVSAAIVLGYR